MGCRPSKNSNTVSPDSTRAIPTRPLSVVTSAGPRPVVKRNSVQPRAESPTIQSALGPIVEAGDADADQLSLAFIKATKSGNLPQMKQLYQDHPQVHDSWVNMRAMWESTPLLYACQYVHAEAALWLLSIGAARNVANEKGVTPLLLASMEGLTSVVDELFKPAPKLSVTSPAKAAAIAMEIRSLRSGGRLRTQGGDPTYIDPSAIDDHIGIVYNAVTDLNMRLNPLIACCMNGHAEIARILLNNQADPNRGLPSSLEPGKGEIQYPLLVAAKYSPNPQVLQVLLEHGANMEQSDGAGNHALSVACMAGKEDNAMQLLKSCNDIIKSLAWKKPNASGKNALHFATASNLLKVAEFLLKDLYWDSDDKMMNGKTTPMNETPLLLAARKKHVAMTELLLRCGADAEIPGETGVNALQLLKRDRNNQHLVQLYMDKKAAKTTSQTAMVPLPQASDQKQEQSHPKTHQQGQGPAQLAPSDAGTGCNNNATSNGPEVAKSAKDKPTKLGAQRASAPPAGLKPTFSSTDDSLSNLLSSVSPPSDRHDHSPTLDLYESSEGNSVNIAMDSGPSLSLMMKASTTATTTMITAPEPPIVRTPEPAKDRPGAIATMTALLAQSEMQQGPDNRTKHSSTYSAARPGGHGRFTGPSPGADPLAVTAPAPPSPGGSSPTNATTNDATSSHLETSARPMPLNPPKVSYVRLAPLSN